MGRKTLNIKGKLFSLEEPVVMAILNITDDSFYEGSRFAEPQKALDAAALHIENGAAILDIGGYSSRPGAKDIAVNEELDRVLPVVELLHKSIHVQVGKNHFRAKVQQHRRLHLYLTSFRRAHLAQLQHHVVGPAQTLGNG